MNIMYLRTASVRPTDTRVSAVLKPNADEGSLRYQNSALFTSPLTSVAGLDDPKRLTQVVLHAAACAGQPPSARPRTCHGCVPGQPADRQPQRILLLPRQPFPALKIWPGPVQVHNVAARASVESLLGRYSRSSPKSVYPHACLPASPNPEARHPCGFPADLSEPVQNIE
jgi:hypothetical protein